MGTATEIKPDALAQSIRGPQMTARNWTTDSAYQYCEQIARAHYENFPVGSLLVPARLRKHFYSIYAFARTADDFADEGYDYDYSEGDRLELLEEWRGMLIDAFHGRARHPIFIALAETHSKFDLPLDLFEDLLSAFAQDVSTRRYETFDQLLDYCRRSANPIGRLILLMFGYGEDRFHLWSDSICTALQLTNHWQDVGVDVDKDRIYIPMEDLARFGLGVEDIKQRCYGESFCDLMRFEIKRAREFFARGKPLCVSVDGRLGLELRAVWLGGSRILNLIEENRYDVYSRRPKIGFVDKLGILLSAVRKGAFSRN